MPDDMTSPARWVWLDTASPNDPNQYADFRATFSCDATSEQWLLRVSVDSNFVTWINGVYVGCGQFGDFPDDRTYSQIDVTHLVKQGENAIAIQAHYCGVDHFSYLPGDAGLWYELETNGQVVAWSDKQTLCRPSPNYNATGTSRITPQRGFTFYHEASEDPPWQSDGYECDDTWQTATELACERTPRPRPVKMLDTRRRVPGVIVAQGLIKRGTDQSVSDSMQHDFLSSRHPWDLFVGFPPNSEPIEGAVTLDGAASGVADGVYVLYDLGREECGFIELNLTSSGRCVIDIAVGEHVDDLRVRAHVGGRSFASRYVACAGEQTFTHWHHRYAGRYIQLHITEFTGTLRLERVGVVAAEYPVTESGRYTESDMLANRIWQTARRTLHLCMFEHYEDCPWREQALYANDSRSQMLCGHYAFGDYGFVRESLDLLLRTTGDDGYQQLCSPMTFEITIPGFTMTWFLALHDYLMYSGDAAYIERVLPQVKRMLRCYEATLEGGLLPCPRGKRYWHFYDWAPGLDGTMQNDCTQFECIDETRFDAPLNALWLMAQRAVAEIAESIGDNAFASQCLATAAHGAEAMHENFYNHDRGLYRTYVGRGSTSHYAELTQSLAILAGVGDGDTRERLRRRLVHPDTTLVPTTLSQSLYKFEAILEDDLLGGSVRAMIASDWSKMLYAGATSFWETQRGGWDFNHAGSLCHGWAGIPVYFFGAYGLGIKPIEPGFKRVKIRPLFDIERMDGVVPTPHGDIKISLRRHDQKYMTELTTPAEIIAEIDDTRIAQPLTA